MNGLSRIVPCMDISRKKILMNAFFRSQFNYCPLIWMCYNRSLNRRINRLHERCLRIIYSDKEFSFDELLDKDESVSIHHPNIQKLGIEMFEVLKGENPPIVNEIFRIRDETTYELWQRSCSHIPSVNTVFSGTESIQFLGPTIWELTPNDIKCLENLRDFKAAIKKWKPRSYPCRICKTYLHGVGFLQQVPLKEFCILYSSEIDLRLPQHLRWSTFDRRERFKVVNYLLKRVPQSWMLHGSHMRGCESVISFIWF